MSYEFSFKSVVLAAGQGTRMKSRLPKVLHRVSGRPMVHYPVQHSLDCGAEEVAVVVGFAREQVEGYLTVAFAEQQLSYWLQEEQRGTADAVRSALGAFEDYEGAIVILYGDVPNLAPSDLQCLLALHQSGSSPISLLTGIDTEGHAYGRIVRDATGRVLSIVEHKDADATQRAIQEVNVGVYVVDAPFLREGLAQTRADNAAGEFYLTDLVAMAASRNRPAQVHISQNMAGLHGVNNRAQLGTAQAYASRKSNEAWMLQGVTMEMPDSVFIEDTVTLGPDAYLEPSVRLSGNTTIGAGAYLEQGVRLHNVQVAEGARIPSLTVASDTEL